jgi:hypothetical protein
VSVIGHTLLWNNTFQYKIFKKGWPETEVNYTQFYGGDSKIVPTRHGQTLGYLTPGLVLGRFRLKDRLSFSLSLFRQSEAVLRSQRRHFIPQTRFQFYRYIFPSEAVGRNPRFHINLVRIGK